MTDDLILWVDLECTGSNVDKDEIIEIGAIITNQKLEWCDQHTRTVQPGPLALGRMMQNTVVREMHTANGLLPEILAMNGKGPRPHQIAAQMLAWMDTVGTPDQMFILAGSGVGHYDKKFIDKYMPMLSRRLRYYVLDVGVIRRAHRMWVGEPEDFTTSKTHRALEDIACHLKEARHYQRLWAP